MAYPADTYSDAVDLSITASNQLHKILNGDSTTEITVEKDGKDESIYLFSRRKSQSIDHELR